MIRKNVIVITDADQKDEIVQFEFWSMQELKATHNALREIYAQCNAPMLDDIADRMQGRIEEIEK